MINVNYNRSDCIKPVWGNCHNQYNLLYLYIIRLGKSGGSIVKHKHKRVIRKEQKRNHINQVC